MSFNIKKIGNTYKINYSGGKFRPVNVNKLPNQTSLLGLDRVYNGQPFVNVVSKFQDTRGLDTVYLGQPFYGYTDAIAVPSSRIFVNNNHPDVNNWLNTVTSNGGSASDTTITALNTFCNSIDSAGLRNRFHRLNLFCGNNLQACLVPLYNSISANAQILGFSADINNNFTNTDYNLTGTNSGLKGSASSAKSLSTGLLSSSLPADSRHLSVIETELSTVAAPTLMGVEDPTNANMFRMDPIGTTQIVYRSASNTTGVGISQRIAGRVYIGSTTEANTTQCYASMYQDSELVAGPTLISQMTPPNLDVRIFASNRSGVTAYFTDARISCYSVGLGLNETQVAAYVAAIQTFQTALNRNV